MFALFSKSCHIIAFVFLIALAVQGQNKGTPPDVKKTVDAFIGHWTFTGSDTEPHPKIVTRLTSTMDCEPTALGMAVSCRVVGDGSDGGHMELSSVIGYSPDERLVRLMEISSTGSYHDHKGPWSDNKIQFEPLTYSISGKKITEYFSISFPIPGKIIIKSVTKTAEGRSAMELTGTRSSSSQ